jgi:hypothetical protein
MCGTLPLAPSFLLGNDVPNHQIMSRGLHRGLQLDTQPIAIYPSRHSFPNHSTVPSRLTHDLCQKFSGLTTLRDRKMPLSQLLSYHSPFNCRDTQIWISWECAMGVIEHLPKFNMGLDGPLWQQWTCLDACNISSTNYWTNILPWGKPLGPRQAFSLLYILFRCKKVLDACWWGFSGLDVSGDPLLVTDTWITPRLWVPKGRRNSIEAYRDR